MQQIEPETYIGDRQAQLERQIDSRIENEQPPRVSLLQLEQDSSAHPNISLHRTLLVKACNALVPEPHHSCPGAEV
jgi:hypothetical protein